MKVLLIILLGLCVGATGLIVPNAEFRTRTLNFFNDVREMMAVGSISRVTTVINTVSRKKIFAKVGPASNMFRLAWSRELEQIAFENSGMFSLQSKEGYGMFLWTGDIIEQVKAIIDALPLAWLLGDERIANVVKEIIGYALDAFAIILRVLAIAVDYPKQFPIVDINSVASTNALFAERTHIGCYNHMITSVCVLKQVPADYSDLFKTGVACSECPEDSRCEITRRDDGWFEEGDMCIPFQNEKPKVVVAERVSEDYDDEATTEGSGSHSLTTTLLIFAVIKILNDFLYE